MWIDDLTAEIETYAESLGIPAPEVDIDNHWRAGQGRVKIDARTATGGAWASHDYLFAQFASGESLKPIILKAGKAAAHHLLQYVATKH